MCDYSLLSVPNRLAKDGDQLVVHRFHTGVIGLVAAEVETRPAAKDATGWWPKIVAWLQGSVSTTDPCVVCVPPCAQLTLHDIPVALQRQYGVSGDEDVTFTQIGADAYRHRDAVRFFNGHEVLLQALTPGQRVVVRSLSGHDEDSVPGKPSTRVLEPAF
jgi:hypothetical protein